MSFAHPALALAAALALFTALGAELFLAARERAIVHPNVGFLSSALHSPAWLRPTLTLAGAISISALVLAAAGPRFGAAQLQTGTIVVCIDTSGSMNANDVPPTRAQAALLAVREFVAALPAQTRIGIIGFAGTAHSLLAPTSDREAFAQALSGLPKPNGQTAIGDALLLAGTLLPATGSRGVLVLTDGKNNRGTDPRFALQMLHAANVATAIVPVARASDPLAQMRGFATRLHEGDAPREWAQPLAFGGLALLAAAWLTRERGAFRP